MFKKIWKKGQEMKQKVIEKVQQKIYTVVLNEQGAVSPLVLVVGLCFIILGILLTISPTFRSAFVGFFQSIVDKVGQLES
ncbi:hypothetical protein DNHGIG_39920 [Collibacillus ludicampi]|uniref:Uncharacterized protein n=1 Tax=Collibacillus ludicampi TaxID=2771369 RepID=A0AAV4LKV1_9BACL|nr:hypothetical protein [Collibacillus ludicampi]GIM48443.1 hypothetical protein DNHGIG_39920 [Collibacillus ludicampi]